MRLIIYRNQFQTRSCIWQPCKSILGMSRTHKFFLPYPGLSGRFSNIFFALNSWLYRCAVILISRNAYGHFHIFYVFLMRENIISFWYLGISASKPFEYISILVKSIEKCIRGYWQAHLKTQNHIYSRVQCMYVESKWWKAAILGILMWKK